MVEQEQGTGITVEALAPEYQAQAQQWAAQLGLPLNDDSAAVALQQLGAQAPGPVRVDFVEGQAAHRRLFGGGSGQMIAKAVGVAQGVRPQVLDATAGLGKDAFVLASLGCQMTLIERQPLVAALLADGLQRARDDHGGRRPRCSGVIGCRAGTGQPSRSGQAPAQGADH